MHRWILFAVLAVIVVPFMIPKSLKKVEHARLVSASPRHTVTVTSKWTKPVSPKFKQHWVAFREPVARTQDVLVTREEWESSGAGSTLTITVLPDGTPHTLQANADVRFEILLVVIEVVALISACVYLAILIARKVRR
jgi:hypothetical protein